MRKSVFVVASAGALAFAFAGAVGAPGVAWGSTAQGPPPTIRDSNAQFGPGKMWAPGDPPVITRSMTGPGSPGNVEFSARTGDPCDGGQISAARTSDPDDGGQVFSARTSDPDDGGQVF